MWNLWDSPGLYLRKLLRESVQYTVQTMQTFYDSFVFVNYFIVSRYQLWRSDDTIKATFPVEETQIIFQRFILRNILHFCDVRRGDTLGGCVCLPVTVVKVGSRLTVTLNTSHSRLVTSHTNTVFREIFQNMVEILIQYSALAGSVLSEWRIVLLKSQNLNSCDNFSHKTFLYLRNP